MTQKVPDVITINVPTNPRDFLSFYIIFQIRVGTFKVITYILSSRLGPDFFVENPRFLQ